MACANVDNPYLNATCTTDGIVCNPSCSLDAVTCEPVDYPASVMVTSTLAASVADIGSIAGTVYPSTVAWTNPQDATSQNGLFATAVIPFGEQSNWLVATGFALAIPSTSTILGIRPVFRGKTQIGTDGTNFSASYLFDCLLTLNGNYFVLNGDLVVPPPGRGALADDGVTIRYVGANIHFGCSDSGKVGCAWTNDVGWIDGLNWWNHICRNEITCDTSTLKAAWTLDAPAATTISSNDLVSPVSVTVLVPAVPAFVLYSITVVWLKVIMVY